MNIQMSIRIAQLKQDAARQAARRPVKSDRRVAMPRVLGEYQAVGEIGAAGCEQVERVLDQGGALDIEGGVAQKRINKRDEARTIVAIARFERPERFRQY